MLRSDKICFICATLIISISGNLVTEVLQVTAGALSHHLSKLYDLRKSDNDTRVVQYVLNRFTSIASMDHLGKSLVDTQEFITIEKVRSVNIILLMKGSRWGTTKDRIAILGSHFDRIGGSPGINDNGSGMAALLEVARLLVTSEGCHRMNSIIFVAFDAEEKMLQGSRTFVNDYLLPEILERSNISTDTFHGAYIMDTIMNYDSRENSQSLPDGLEQLLPKEVEIIKKNQNRGNFLAAIGRDLDQNLLDLLSWHWNYTHMSSMNPNSSYNILPLMVPSMYLPLAPHLMRSDHYNFWDCSYQSSSEGLRAVFLTDSAEFRGFMEECYHQPCDDLRHVTKDSLHFLAITTYTLKTLLHEVSSENKHCFQEVHIEYLSDSSASNIEDKCTISICTLMMLWLYTGGNRR